MSNNLPWDYLFSSQTESQKENAFFFVILKWESSNGGEETEKISLFLPQGMRQCSSKTKWRVNELKRGRKVLKKAILKRRPTSDYNTIYLSDWIFLPFYLLTPCFAHFGKKDSNDCLWKEKSLVSCVWKRWNIFHEFLIFCLKDY